MNTLARLWWLQILVILAVWIAIWGEPAVVLGVVVGLLVAGRLVWDLVQRRRNRVVSNGH